MKRKMYNHAVHRYDVMNMITFFEIVTKLSVFCSFFDQKTSCAFLQAPCFAMICIVIL